LISHLISQRQNFASRSFTNYIDESISNQIFCRCPPPNCNHRSNGGAVTNINNVKTDHATSTHLGKQSQKDTKPERIVRSVLHNLGVRFRLNNRDLRGSPDIANRKRKWVVFVHGCFWHSHPGCPRATVPKRNADFWIAKFAANRTRDENVIKRNHDLGYDTLVVWECQTKSLDGLRQMILRSAILHEESKCTRSSR
jgi:DNA mismatch endonuclease, patch repair protein